MLDGHRVLGIARTHSEAVNLTRRKGPGLILADIQLADNSSGLDAVNELLNSYEVPVVFKEMKKEAAPNLFLKKFSTEEDLVREVERELATVPGLAGKTNPKAPQGN